MTLIERVARHEDTRVPHAEFVVAGCQGAEGALAQQRGGTAQEASTLTGEPDLESWAVGERETGEQHDRSGAFNILKIAALELLDVHDRARKVEADEVTLQGIWLAQQPSECGQVPSQGTQRVDRLAEQELGEVGPRVRLSGHGQVGQQTPRLCALGRRTGDTVDQNDGSSQEMDIEMRHTRAWHVARIGVPRLGTQLQGRHGPNQVPVIGSMTA